MKKILGIVSILLIAAVCSGYQPSKTGWLKIQLPSLPEPQHKANHLLYSYNPAQEVFEIYIPPSYNGDEKYGVLGWINPHDGAGVPHKFEALLNEFKLIAVSAARSGNEQDPARRIGLLECAITELSKTLNIDHDRVIVGGKSGGGRTSAMACFIHSEFWNGAISHVGGHFYKKYPVPMPVGASSPGINDHTPGLVSMEQVKAAKQNARFVLITGSKDFNLMDSRGIYRALKQEDFAALLIEEPELAHEIASPESMKQALEFIFSDKK